MKADNAKTTLAIGIVGICLLGVPISALDEPDADSVFLTWGEKQASNIARATRADGRVGGFFDTRIISTNRSYNYKLRATWLTPDVIRATARLTQLELALSDEQTRALVAEAEAIGDTIMMIEIDPREGSGVIPRDWIALLRPKGNHREGNAVDGPSARGILRPEGRRMKALAGAYERDYAYDVFWLSFAVVDESGAPLFSGDVDEAELIVRIAGKEGRVSWKIPSSLRP